MTNNDIARVARAATSTYQQVIGSPASPGLDQAPDWQRESLLAGVEVALGGATAAEQHEAWMRWHLARGWTYGPVRDEQTRTHPNLVPYAELPAEQQLLDRLFVAVVRALAA
jgi:hypothetical protein